MSTSALRFRERWRGTMPSGHRMRDGDSKALTDERRRDDARGRLDRVWPLVFGELKRVAHRRLGAEREGHTLCTTALVHEVYLRLVDQRFVAWDDRGDFFAQAGRAMRRILVDYARRHRALRRGGGVVPISLNVDDSVTSEMRSAPQIAVAERADEIIALDEALVRFAELEPRAAAVVECRFFAGLTEDETAAALSVTPRTVARDWVKARAWLYRELNDSAANAS